jgi:PAS domain S-box-containing protein
MNNIFQDKDNNLNLKSSVELLFGQFWEISVDGMRITDEQGKILAVNEAFCRIVDMQKDKLEGKLFPVIYHQDEHQSALDIYEDDLKNESLKTYFEAERNLWNNKKVWFEFSNSFIHLAGIGKIVLSIINDITQRKNAEIELLKNEKRYRMLFNNGNDAVSVNHLRDDNRFDHFIEVNDIACLRLGYTRDELQHMDLYKTIPDKYSKELEKAGIELQRINHVIFEVMQIRKDKRLIPVEISAHLFEFDDKPTILSIARDITERKRGEVQLRQTSIQLRNLASRLQTIREEERTMISREIHDELGQVITVLKIQIALLTNKLRKDQNHLKEKFGSVSQMLDQMVDTVQKITSKLRPEILDELGLIPAIEWQAQQFQERTGITCDVRLPKSEIVLEKDKSTAIFRIFQEALTNVARHAIAEKISVILKNDIGKLVLEVTDNGQGIRKSQIEDSSSLGILGMKERALVLGGIVTINGVPGKGTNVKVEIPLLDE